MESNQSTCSSRSLQPVVRQYPLFFYAHASVDCPDVDGLLALFPGVSMVGMHWAPLIGLGIPALPIVVLTCGRLGCESSQKRPSRREMVDAKLAT